MGSGFQRKKDDGWKRPTSFDNDDWGQDQPDNRPVPPPRNDRDSWSNTRSNKRRGVGLSRIPIGPIVIVILIIVAGVLIWTYRDLISNLLITVLSWALSVVITIAIIVIILRLIFRPRRRSWWW